jgi:hypothetical protein
LIICLLSIIGILFEKLINKTTIPVNPIIIRVMRILRVNIKNYLGTKKSLKMSYKHKKLSKIIKNYQIIEGAQKKRE